MGIKQRLQKLALGAIEKFAPEAEEDSYLDLKREELEGKIERSKAGIWEVPKPAADEAPKPFFRKDGQVHNFNAIPFPGSTPMRPFQGPNRQLTRAQYEARYAGQRPEPKNSVAWIATATPEPELAPAPRLPESQMYRDEEDDEGDDQ